MSDVAIIMGSDSDWPVMEDAAKVLDSLGISYSADVVSAHRMPLEMVEFAQSAKMTRMLGVGKTSLLDSLCCILSRTSV